ncbi:glycoside hydrolase family 127 protein [Planctomonas psychrotolerans]|uniref:glycoside hydrolase family 127 protein n=1 Tax=Planctomonas psychrotolerans TaxID=2528712 RepID=UPI0012396F19|nr:glycoside hydrolase family 127 protein [Planctomonas psychrotolerans]
MPTAPLDPPALARVRLLDGPLAESQRVNAEYLLRLDPDRLLAPFLREAGLPRVKPSYGNWENEGLDGHTAGHYLSAAAMLYAATGDRVVLDRLDHMVDVLETCQREVGSGYVGGIPDGLDFWADVRAGRVGSDSFSLGGRWVPWYNLHKLFAGLLDAERYAGSHRARDVVIRLADWWLGIAADIDDERFERMLDTEFGGMNEVFAELAARTGSDDYLAMAKRFTHATIADPLVEGRDALTGLHANTQIPKVVGYARVAALSGDERLATAAREFWRIVVANRSVAFGGNSAREHFHDSADFTPMLIERQGPETCNSHNMLRLSESLYSASADPKYLDYYERTLFNHILSAQHPEHGGFVYFTPVRPGHYRVYSAPEDGFWCCVGTGLESHAKLGELVYTRTGGDVEVNLFVASTFEDAELGLTLRQETRFPFEDISRLTVDVAEPRTFGVSIRVPSWASAPITVLVNGEAVDAAAGAGSPAGRIRVERAWHSGDVIEVTTPMAARVEPLPDGSPWGAVCFGPIVLAARTGTDALDGLIADDSRMGHVASGPLVPFAGTPILAVPGLAVAGADANASAGAGALETPVDLEVVDRGALRFAIRAVDGTRVELEPFFGLHDARYTMYWPLVPSDADGGAVSGMRSLLAELDESLALDVRTLDSVGFGEQQPESDHAFTGSDTRVGSTDGVHWRETTDRFAVRIRTHDGAARSLRVVWLATDAPAAFTVSVDGEDVFAFDSAEDESTAAPNVDTDTDGDAAPRGSHSREVDIPPAERDTLTVEVRALRGRPSARIREIRLLAAL